MGWKKKKNNRAVQPQEKKPRTAEEMNNIRPPIETTNELFVQYYKMQNLMEESEWDDFMTSLGRRLPTTFRITGTKSHADVVRETLERDFFPALEVLVEGEAYKTPTPIPWYPTKLAYHCELPRQQLRKNPQFESFQKFLVNETDLGNISRQEAVSMIPPLLLDVQPGHKVLDMCAAPGSKTGQLIEMIHAQDDLNDPIMTDGLVMANDFDHRRCHMLVHQVKRLRSTSLMVTNQNAAHFPTIYQPGPKGRRVPMQFDRVLCDVPCSGDGTLRKNPTGWKMWGPMVGPTNHNLQIRIFKRGCQMLSIGGYIVYSTCSFHPLENEAVVAEVLRTYKGKLELVDVSDRLPELKRRPGLTTWKVMRQKEKGSKDWEVADSMDDLAEWERCKYKPSMWPQDDLQDLHMERCVRVLPQDQNTGGFFIAVIKKTDYMSSLDHRSGPMNKKVNPTEEGNEQESISEDTEIAEEKSIATETETEADSGPEIVVDLTKGSRAAKAITLKEWSEDPYVFMLDKVPAGAEGILVMKNGKEILDPIIEYYQFPDTFPADRCLMRTEEGKGRYISLVTPLVRDVLMGNQDMGLRIINSGLKVMQRSEQTGVDVDYRLQQEGTRCLASMLGPRTITVTYQDVLQLLRTQDGVKFVDVSEELQKNMTKLGPGSVVMHFNAQDPACKGEECLIREDLLLCIWVGRNTVRTMVSEKEAASLLGLMMGPAKAQLMFKELKAEAAKAKAEEEAVMAVNNEQKDPTLLVTEIKEVKPEENVNETKEDIAINQSEDAAVISKNEEATVLGDIEKEATLLVTEVKEVKPEESTKEVKEDIAINQSEDAARTSKNEEATVLADIEKEATLFVTENKEMKPEEHANETKEDDAINQSEDAVVISKNEEATVLTDIEKEAALLVTENTEKKAEEEAKPKENANVVETKVDDAEAIAHSEQKDMPADPEGATPVATDEAKPQQTDQAVATTRNNTRVVPVGPESPKTNAMTGCCRQQ